MLKHSEHDQKSLHTTRNTRLRSVPHSAGFLKQLCDFERELFAVPRASLPFAEPELRDLLDLELVSQADWHLYTDLDQVPARARVADTQHTKASTNIQKTVRTP